MDSLLLFSPAMSGCLARNGNLTALVRITQTTDLERFIHIGIALTMMVYAHIIQSWYHRRPAPRRPSPWFPRAPMLTV